MSGGGGARQAQSAAASYAALAPEAPAPRVPAPRTPAPPVTDTLDAAAVAWSTWRIATGQAIVLPDQPQLDRQGREITIRY